MKKVGFTLVELVITITILVILSTIAFVSFQSYTQDSRDANRLSSLNEIQKGLTLSYSKNGSFPTPKNATTYTGGTISLLQGTLTQEILPELQSDPKDPLSKSSYSYSITSDGEYFQIASDIENTDVLSQTTPQKTYAKVSSALVKGNYKFDPSLPSLIVIPTTSLTNSGIFSPDNCFVTNGGSNMIGNTSCTTKKLSLGKNTDSSLVGYWDMETLTGTQLLDLSGNGNSGVFTGMTYATALTGGLISKGLRLVSAQQSCITVNHSESFNFGLDDTFSISVLVKPITSENINLEASIVEKWDVSTNSYPFVIRYNTNPTLEIWGKKYLRIKNTFSGYTYSRITPITDPYLQSSDIQSVGNKNSVLSDEFVYLTYKKEKGKFIFYYNGNKVDEEALSLLLSPKNTSSLYIGCRGKNPNQVHFSGIIDEVKIYNRALSDKEIEQQAKILGF